MAFFPSLLALGMMTLAALYCSVRGCNVWLFVLLLLGAALSVALVRAAGLLRAAARRTRPPRIIVLHLLKRNS